MNGKSYAEIKIKTKSSFFKLSWHLLFAYTEIQSHWNRSTFKMENKLKIPLTFCIWSDTMKPTQKNTIRTSPFVKIMLKPILFFFHFAKITTLKVCVLEEEQKDVFWNEQFIHFNAQINYFFSFWLRFVVVVEPICSARSGSPQPVEGHPKSKSRKSCSGCALIWFVSSLSQ